MKSKKHPTIVACKFILILIILCVNFSSIAQKSVPGDNLPPPQTDTINPRLKWLKVRNIVITGNKKTKEYIIIREMVIKPGDSILIINLTKKLEVTRQNIYNTLLFVTVKVEPFILNAFQFDVIVSVKEKFYIFPVPQFQLVDRSFDEWLVKYKGSLTRVNYGINFVDNNLSGRKDLLRLSITNGYTRNISAYYGSPYSNPKLTAGYYIGAGFSQTREIAFKTNYDNNFEYYKNGGFVRNSWNIFGGYIIRKAIRKSQIFSAGYTNVSVSDSIITNNLNPRYFNSKSTRQGVIDLGYTIRYTNVNNILYPLTGVSGYVAFQKRGLGLKGGINMFSIEGEYDRYIALGKKWYASVQATGKIKLPFDQPFINQRALGDNNAYLRGYDYFNIDGVAYSTAKFNLKREIINFTIPTFFKSKTYRKIPFKVFAKAFTDFGYVYSRELPITRLNNKLLYTGGLGIDILTLYDIRIRFDYSINQLGENRLAVNNRSGF